MLHLLLFLLWFIIIRLRNVTKQEATQPQRFWTFNLFSALLHSTTDNTTHSYIIEATQIKIFTVNINKLFFTPHPISKHIIRHYYTTHTHTHTGWLLYGQQGHFYDCFHEFNLYIIIHRLLNKLLIPVPRQLMACHINKYMHSRLVRWIWL